MIEVVSLVNFNNEKRIRYLDKSFKTFHDFYPSNVRHIVLDSSTELNGQQEAYERYGVELYHMPDSSYSSRLKKIYSLVKSDYFVFLPDDFVWIFNYPIERAIEEAAASNIAQLKLSCRGMPWFSEENPTPSSWYHENKLISGEILVKNGKCYISKRWWYRDFHEQFSLAATITNKVFLHNTIKNISDNIFSPGEAEKRAYIKLLFKPYNTGYFDMLIPAFHFCEYEVEGKDKEYTMRDMLIEKNYDIYNSLFNSRS